MDNIPAIVEGKRNDKQKRRRTNIFILSPAKRGKRCKPFKSQWLIYPFERGSLLMPLLSSYRNKNKDHLLRLFSLFNSHVSVLCHIINHDWGKKRHRIQKLPPVSQTSCYTHMIANTSKYLCSFKFGTRRVILFPSGRMGIVLASFILAVQEILYPVYFVLLFINDQSELNSLVAKNACYIPQGTSHSLRQTMNSGAIVIAFVSENHWICKVWLMRNKCVSWFR